MDQVVDQIDAAHPNVVGDVCLRKQRRKRQKILVTELLLDYAKHSTLHGLRYITERGVSLVEKIFWILTFTISVVLCFCLIVNVWAKWKTSPVIVSFSEKFVSVGMVPFPSVTICPQIKSKTSKYDFSKEYQRLMLNDSFIQQFRQDDVNFFEENPALVPDYQKLENIALICNSMNMPGLMNETYRNATVVEQIREVSPKIDDVFYFCKWRDQYYSECRGLFTEVLTYEGVCFNFNALAAEEIFKVSNIQTDYKYLLTQTKTKGWTLSKGYEAYDVENEYPKRGLENGATPDLEIILVENVTERNGLCNPMNRGYKIYVQHPADEPQSSLYYYAALPKQVSSLALKFNMLTTANSLLNYDPSVRQCYFPKDRPLRYFNLYSANNCRLECQSNYTFHICGCVLFHMPHILVAAKEISNKLLLEKSRKHYEKAYQDFFYQLENIKDYDSQRICTVEKYRCVIEALDQLRLKELNSESERSAQSNREGGCRCYPDCHSVYYDAEILKTHFDFHTYIKTFEKMYNFTFEFNGLEFSKIEMYFKEPRFVSMQRSELFGLTDFMANCGGLLGLFLGFSFLSLVEIFYFITLRLYFAFKRDLRKQELERKNY